MEVKASVQLDGMEWGVSGFKSVTLVVMEMVCSAGE